MPAAEACSSGVRLCLLIQPRASRNELAGRHGEMVRIRLAAPPVDGAANDALIRFLADVLGTARSAISITAGQSGRRKTVVVEGIGLDQARERLGL